MTEAKVKSNTVVKTTHDEANGRLVFTVGDQSATLNLSAISEAIRSRAVVHGLKQRIADRAAIGRDPTTGQPAPQSERFEAIRAMVDHYNSGTEDWNLAGTGTGPGLDRIMLAAIVEAMDWDETKVKEVVAKKAEEHKITQRAYITKIVMESAKVRPIYERMQRETSPTIDVDGDLV